MPDALPTELTREEELEEFIRREAVSLTVLGLYDLVPGQGDVNLDDFFNGTGGLTASLWNRLWPHLGREEDSNPEYEYAMGRAHALAALQLASIEEGISGEIHRHLAFAVKDFTEARTGILGPTMVCPRCERTIPDHPEADHCIDCARALHAEPQKGDDN
jgi:hypothetical protein